MIKNFLAASIAALFAPLASAAAPFVVKDIRVEGVQRVEVGTVFNYLPIRIGDKVDDERISQAFKALYATGFFRDVRFDVDKEVLVVIVDERPAIARISLSGNQEFKDDVLLKGLKEAGIAEARTFDRSVLDRVEQEIKQLYLTKSYYGVSVRSTASPLERNRVAINIEVQEGDIAKIRQVKVLGTEAYSANKIADLMALSETGSFSWWTKNDRYSRQKLQADLEEIRSWYLNHGFADFNIESSQVSITPEKKDVYITVAVKEGLPYKIKNVKLAGDLLVPEAELAKLITIKSGEVFSRERVNEVSRKIGDRLGNEGYAFATVNPIPELDKATQQVNLSFFIDPGRRVYVNKINIAGNSKTQSEVIRREVRQLESTWYDKEKIDRSKTRLDRTGFFEEVTVEPDPVPGSNDQVDINIKVKEKNTGNLSFGVGYSQTEKAVLSASISQNNFLGTGNALNFSVSSGRVNQNLILSYTNPYFTESGVSRGFDVYQRKLDTGELTTGRYATRAQGAGIRFGIPIAEDDSISFGTSFDKTDIGLFDNSPQKYKDFVTTYGETVYTALFNAGWARDRRDSLIYPTRGFFLRVFGDVTFPVADLRYGRLGTSGQYFIPLTNVTTLMFGTEVGWGTGYSGRELPFYKNYYAGGIGSVRGYRDASLGPRGVNNLGQTESLGGNRLWTNSVELLFPMPGLKEKDRSLRLSTFFDIGQVWGKGDRLQLSEMRKSYGVAMSWASPIGPLKFSLGFPISARPDDNRQKFQFQIGQIF